MTDENDNKNNSNTSNKMIKPTSNKVRLPGVLDEKDALRSFKAQFENMTTLKKIKRVPRQAEALIVGGY